MEVQLRKEELFQISPVNTEIIEAVTKEIFPLSNIEKNVEVDNLTKPATTTTSEKDDLRKVEGEVLPETKPNVTVDSEPGQLVRLELTELDFQDDTELSTPPPPFRQRQPTTPPIRKDDSPTKLITTPDPAVLETPSPSKEEVKAGLLKLRSRRGNLTPTSTLDKVEVKQSEKVLKVPESGSLEEKEEEVKVSLPNLRSRRSAATTPIPVTPTPESAPESPVKPQAESSSKAPSDSPVKLAPESPRKVTQESPLKLVPDSTPKASPESPQKPTSEFSRKPIQDSQQKVAPDSPRKASPEYPKKGSPDPLRKVPESPEKAAPELTQNPITELPGKSASESPRKVLPESPRRATTESPRKTVPESPRVVALESPRKAGPESPRKNVSESPRKPAGETTSRLSTLTTSVDTTVGAMVSLSEKTELVTHVKEEVVTVPTDKQINVSSDELVSGSATDKLEGHDVGVIKTSEKQEDKCPPAKGRESSGGKIEESEEEFCDALSDLDSNTVTVTSDSTKNTSSNEKELVSTIPVANSPKADRKDSSDLTDEETVNICIFYFISFYCFPFVRCVCLNSTFLLFIGGFETNHEASSRFLE